MTPRTMHHLVMRAVLFDLDGVLIDSVPSALSARRVILANLGISPDDVIDPHGEDHMGGSLADWLRQVRLRFPEVVVDFESIAEQQTELVARDLIERRIGHDPVVHDLIDNLKSSSISVGLVTSGIRKAVNAKLQLIGLSGLFELIITADDLERHKPFPDPYLRAAGELYVRPDQVVAIEDSNAGILSALRADMTPICFTRFRSSGELPPGALQYIDSWSQLDLAVLAEFVDRRAGAQS